MKRFVTTVTEGQALDIGAKLCFTIVTKGVQAHNMLSATEDHVRTQLLWIVGKAVS